MNTRRRGMLYGASALGLLGASTAAFAQKKESGPAVVSSRPDPADFEAALRSKFTTSGIETQSSIPYQEPRDLNISQTYFVENKGPGLNASEGLSMAQGCGFENNGGCGIKLMNEGRLFACRASTHGPQPYLLDAFLTGGTTLMDACFIEGYGGFEG